MQAWDDNTLLRDYVQHGSEAAFAALAERHVNKVYSAAMRHVRDPARIYVTLDERSDTINDRSFCVDMSNTGNMNGKGADHPYWMIDFPGACHAGTGRLSFADGHVETRRWLEPTTLVPLGQAESGTYTSPKDRDVQWLQDHCTFLK